MDTAEEFARRASVAKDYAASLGIDFIEQPYTPANWEDCAGMLGGPYPMCDGRDDYDDMREKRRVRCRECYRQRFEATAAIARELGINKISTTLTISPYQFVDDINGVLQDVASQNGLQAVKSDFRSRYHDSVVRSRELCMYRQNYCACRFSKAEAQIERDARKAARKALKAQRKAQNVACEQQTAQAAIAEQQTQQAQ
jgi:predicted adenine nucleotide alpha hydrolase (AANH) superfamily ATPase